MATLALARGAVAVAAGAAVSSRLSSRMDNTPAKEGPGDSTPGAEPVERKSAGGVECPLCAMVKAGPCKESFYPFEACLDRCAESEEKASEACKEPFMDMMRCMAKVRSAPNRETGFVMAVGP